jgi:hypothetical protein
MVAYHHKEGNHGCKKGFTPEHIIGKLREAEIKASYAVVGEGEARSESIEPHWEGRTYVTQDPDRPDCVLCYKFARNNDMNGWELREEYSRVGER